MVLQSSGKKASTGAPKEAAAAKNGRTGSPVREPLTVSVDEVLEEIRTYLCLEFDIEAADVQLDGKLQEDPLSLDSLCLVQVWEFLADQFQLEFVPQDAIWMPDTVMELCQAAVKVIGDPQSYVPVEQPSLATAFMFPGQGAQKLGMARELVAAFGPAKKMFEQANEQLQFDLLELCTKGPEKTLNQTDISQPAILVSSLAKLEELRSTQPKLVNECNCCCGLSLGEYSALVFAGAISFEDALSVVQVRGTAMQKASELEQSGMTSVLGLDLKTVEQLVQQIQAQFPEKVLVIANDLCPGNVVISGHVECLAAAEELAMGEDFAAKKIRRLQVAGAFHSSLMDPAVPALEAALKKITIKPPKIPVILNTTGKPTKDVDTIREQLVKQVTSPVQWRATMEYVMKNHEQVHEIGPGDVLRGLARHVARALKKSSVTIESHVAK